jgi:uncharacterized protein (TIGR02466 family)
MNMPSSDIAAAGIPGPDKGLMPENWFGVPIWTRLVTDHEAINAKILEAAAELHTEMASVTRSNVGGWHSRSTLHRDERFAVIRGIISRAVFGCAHHLDFDFGSADIVFQELWLNRNRRGDFNRTHVHPNSFLSGSYYVKVPPDSGNLEFYDPIRERVMTRFPLRRHTRGNSQPLEYRCREGMLVIFPSWLQHAVQASRSDEPRISLAFNITCRRKAE